jgi:hypothetical protein
MRWFVRELKIYLDNISGTALRGISVANRCSNGRTNADTGRLVAGIDSAAQYTDPTSARFAVTRHSAIPLPR